VERYKHRKHLAVSFSSKNLEYTQKVMKECLQKFGKLLKQMTDDGTPFMLDNMMIRLTLDIITESAFGFNFNTLDGNKDNLGEFYMSENELVLKEAARSALNPVRKYMFWNEEHRRALQARSNMMALAQNLIDSHREKMAEGVTDSSEDKSIMGRIMSCAYESDDNRAHDILIMLLGGHGKS
jgi:cytochrome P450